MAAGIPAGGLLPQGIAPKAVVQPTIAAPVAPLPPPADTSAAPIALPQIPATPEPAKVAPTIPVAPVAPTVPAVPVSRPAPALPLESPPVPLPPPGEPPVFRDVTPPGFLTDIVPHDAPDHHPGPGYLAPALAANPGLFTSVELLVMRPRRDGFDYAILNRTAGLVTNGPVQSLNYELRGGLRAELGYRFGGCGWEVLTGYTYFRSTTGSSITAGPGQELLPTLTRPGLTDRALVAAAGAKLEYNVYDLLLARRFAVDDHLTLRLLGGMRFASIRQDLTATYDGLDARVAGVLAKSGFEGFGPVVGGEAVFAGWRGFHLYARASGGLLTGMSRNPLTETNDAGRTVYTNVSNDFRKVVPMASVGVGGGWQYRNVWIRTGYEITRWFDLTSQPQFVDDVAQGRFLSRPGSLSLEGLFVQAGVAF